MKKYAKVILNFVYVVVGAALLIAGSFEKMDSIWSGFGGGLVGCGLVLLIKNIRYLKNEEYKEKVDIEIEDERNKYIRMKAWSWAGYLFVLFAGVTTIVCMIMKQYEYMQMASYDCCGMLLLYWVSYIILRKKY